MSQEEQPSKGPAKWRFRAILHIVIGVLYLVLAGYVIYFHRFIVDLEPLLAYGVGGLLTLYGLFRIWRGWKDSEDTGRQF